MNNNELIYESLDSQEAVENKTYSYLSTDDGLKTFQCLFGCKKFTIGFFFAILVYFGIGFALILNFVQTKSFSSFIEFTDFFICYFAIGCFLMLVTALIFFIVYNGNLKDLSKINPFFEDAYRHYKRAVVLGLISATLKGVSNSSHSEIGKSVGNLASVGFDVAGTYNEYKSTFNLVYGIMYELSKENVNSRAIEQGREYIQKYKQFIILCVVSSILLVMFEAFYGLSGYSVDNYSPLVIGLIVFVAFLTFIIVYIEVLYFKFLKASYKEFEKSNYNRKISGGINY